MEIPIVMLTTSSNEQDLLGAQIELADADHYFTDQDDALVDAVTLWLRSLGSL